MTPQASEKGRALKREQAPPRRAAHAARRSATTRPSARRTRVVKPKVTTEELAKKYPAILVVDRPSFKLTLYKNLEKAKTYNVAIGAAGLDTPAGLYHIQNKAVDPAWTMPNSDWAAPADRGKVVPPRPGEPAQGALDGHLQRRRHPRHGPDGSLGTAASHGCVRMPIPDVIELYDQVPVGAPIYIA